MWYPFVQRPSVRKQYLVSPSPSLLNTGETHCSSYIVGPMVWLCMCNFGPVWTPWGPQGDFVKKLGFPSMCLRGLIIVLFCRIHCLDVHVPAWSSQNALQPKKREKSKIHPPPPPPFTLVRDKILFSTNRMHLRDLKWYVKMCSSFLCLSK